MKITNTGRALIILLIAVALLVGVSFMPLSRWTGGKIRDINLFSDILNLPADTLTDTVATENIDPDLAALMQLGEEEIQQNSTDSSGITGAAALIGDSVARYVDRDTVIQPIKNNRVAGKIAIEDYTTGNIGMLHLRAALKQGRLARIAMVGDSYIEGDIFAQDLRLNLQNAYGGEGVGYVNMQTDFAGFRRSIKQSGNGWKSYIALKKQGKKQFYNLAEQYFTPTGTATSTYQGVSTIPHLKQWSRSRFLFIAPNNTTISTRTAAGDWVEHEVKGSDGVQCLLINEPTSEFSVKTTDTKLIGLGVWLDGTKGISLDCMSSRGLSGISLSEISASLCRAMARDVNYDLIILEFGINAMSAGQSNYSVYSKHMVKVINHVRTCYPNADILLLGIGDRGQKKGSEVHSMSVASNMIAAQRDAARTAHCLFWDTREAMGGEDAVVAWSQQKLINKDYIHLTHEGGKKLAGLLFEAMQQMLK